MEEALLREPSVLDQERADDVPRPEAIPELVAEEAESFSEIDAALERDRAVADAAGVGKGMHASLRRSRPGAGGSGAKAVLADKRAHDLDKDIARRRANAALADHMTKLAHGTHMVSPSMSWAAVGSSEAAEARARGDGAAGAAEAGAAAGSRYRRDGSNGDEDDKDESSDARAPSPAPADHEDDDDDDDDGLAAIRRRRLMQMRLAASTRVGRVVAFASKADMGEALAADRAEADEGRAPRWRVVHLSESWHAGCRAVDVALAGVAGLCEAALASGALPCPITCCRVESGVAIPGFDPDGLPTLALYRGGHNAEQLIAVLGGEDAASSASVATVSAVLRASGVPVPLAA